MIRKRQSAAPPVHLLQDAIVLAQHVREQREITRVQRDEEMAERVPLSLSQRSQPPLTASQQQARREAELYDDGLSLNALTSEPIRSPEEVSSEPKEHSRS